MSSADKDPHESLSNHNSSANANLFVENIISQSLGSNGEIDNLELDRGRRRNASREVAINGEYARNEQDTYEDQLPNGGEDDEIAIELSQVARSGSKGGTFCRGNPIRTCHKNEFTGGSGDARGRCAICTKKSAFFCLSCEQYFCMSAQNSLLGEDKFLQFSVTQTGRRRAGTKREETGEDKNINFKGEKTAGETILAIRSCWNIFHSDVLKVHGVVGVQGKEFPDESSDEEEIV